MHYSDQGYKEKKRARSREKTDFSRSKIGPRAEKIDIVYKKSFLILCGFQGFFENFSEKRLTKFTQTALLLPSFINFLSLSERWGNKQRDIENKRPAA